MKTLPKNARMSNCLSNIASFALTSLQVEKNIDGVVNLKISGWFISDRGIAVSLSLVTVSTIY